MLLKFTNLFPFAFVLSVLVVFLVRVALVAVILITAVSVPGIQLPVPIWSVHTPDFFFTHLQTRVLLLSVAIQLDELVHSALHPPEGFWTTFEAGRRSGWPR